MSTLSPMNGQLDILHAPSAGRTRFLRRFLPLWDLLVVLIVFDGTASGWNGDGVGLTAGATLLAAIGSPLVIAGLGGYVGAAGVSRLSLRGVGRLLLASAASVWMALAVGAAVGANPSLGQLLVVSLLLPAGWIIGRLVIGRFDAKAGESVIVVGSGPVACRFIDISRRKPELGLHVVGIVDDDPLDSAYGPPVLGRVADLPYVLSAESVDRVVVAFTNREDSEVMGILRDCHDHSINVDIIPRFFDLLGPSAQASSLEGLPLVTVPARGNGAANSRGKRIVDAVGSAFALIALSPAMLVIAAAIKLDDGGPVFFRQRRIGLGATPFSVLKFRTMGVDAERSDAQLLNALSRGEIDIESAVADIKGEKDPRITRVGSFLRRTSLDELPQFWNVLVGDMSLVGPRPLRDFEVDALTDWQRVRQDVRPGITGLWQVSGRSDIGWNERIQLDYDYVNHWSLPFDLSILARTVPAVFKKKGAV